MRGDCDICNGVKVDYIAGMGEFTCICVLEKENEMKDLIERLKKLEGPCRECDVLIHIAFSQHPNKSYSYGVDPYTEQYVGIFNGEGVHAGNVTPTPYTSSIDAARKLIRGRDVVTIVIGGPSGGSCDILDIWTDKENRWKGVHSSPAIAICIATIQSHQISNDEDE